MKELIKQLAAEQIELKKSRKTGSRPGIEEANRSNCANAKVQRNKIRITAALNLYHEIRGSSYNHNVRPENEYYYKKCMEELRETHKANL